MAQILKQRTPQVEHIIDCAGLNSGDFHLEEFWAAIDQLELSHNFQYVRMDFGVPGLPPPDTCLEIHQRILREGQIPKNYPPHTGVPQLTEAIATLITQRLRAVIAPQDVFVTCGATQALFVAQAVAAQLGGKTRAALFLTPNYPPMCAQARFLGMRVLTVNIDGMRGPVLLDSLRRVFEAQSVASICWASPSNPGWTILNDGELAGIADLCRAYNVIPIEDLTYLGMTHSYTDVDPSCFPSISRHADDYFLTLSTSKMLSYAGERIGFLAGSSSIMDKVAYELEIAFGTWSVRRACGSLIFNSTGGASHSAQLAVAAIVEAINHGQYDLDSHLQVYRDRATVLKRMLLEHGFYVLSPENVEADDEGFYVSFGYPGLSAVALVKKLLSIGISVLPIEIFGSTRRDIVRACVGRLEEDKLILLAERLVGFSEYIDE